MELGFRIPIVSGIPDSLSCIPDSKALNSGFNKPRFPGMRNQDSITWGDSLVSDELKIKGEQKSKLVVL